MVAGPKWKMPDLGNNLFCPFTRNNIFDSVAELIPQVVQAVHRRWLGLPVVCLGNSLFCPFTGKKHL
jgi:hypothetical protein